MKPLMLTLLAMLAFAANSVLCRMALGDQLIDATSFTTIRLVSGAITLIIIVLLKDSSVKKNIRLDLKASLALFLYAICFSFAYIDLTTGTGALILFGTVQLTIVIYGVMQGDRPLPSAWLGILIACAGLAYLVSPGVTAPSLAGTILMITAGLAWGVYTWRGKGVSKPVAATTWNFIGTVPMTLIASLVFLGKADMQINGVLLAVLSGALASGVGYVIWYAALPFLKPSSAAVVQLSVPMIAALGGVAFMSEPLTLRLSIASAAILGGIALVINANRTKAR